MGRKRALDVIREAQELRRMAKGMGPKAAAEARAKADKMEQKGVREMGRRPNMRKRTGDGARKSKGGNSHDYIR